MPTFNFGNGTTIINSKMADVINNVEIGSRSGTLLQREDLFQLFDLWKLQGLPPQQYAALKESLEATPVIGRNPQTRKVIEKIAAIAKTAGAVAETYTGLASVVNSLSELLT